MTKRELSQYEKRMDEIEAILTYCGPNDQDVAQRLENELQLIIMTLETYVKPSRYTSNMSPLKLIQGQGLGNGIPCGKLRLVSSQSFKKVA